MLDNETILHEEKLRASLAPNPQFSGFPEVEAKRAQMLAWLDDTTEDPDWPVFSATIDYMATGEGQTHYLIVSRASNYREFIHHLFEELDGYYFVIGADIFKGVPDENRTTRLLLNENLRDDILNEMARKSGCSYNVNLFYHVNCS